jgi:hypothetical protein
VTPALLTKAQQQPHDRSAETPFDFADWFCRGLRIPNRLGRNICGRTEFERAERTLAEIRARLREAKTEEQFQAIGVLAREAMISLAQAVYVRATHPPLDGTEPSETDAKRMLEAYFAAELADNDAARKHVRATVDFANTLQHKRTATGIEAALCAEATSSVLICFRPPQELTYRCKSVFLDFGVGE